MTKPAEKKNKEDESQKTASEKLAGSESVRFLKKEVSPEENLEKKKAEKKIENRKSTIKFVIFAAALIILFLAIVLVPAFIRKINFEKNKYNSFEFIQQKDSFWYTKVQKGSQPYWIPFYYHPRELEDIPVETGLGSKFFDIRDNNGSIYITLDPDSGNNTIIIAGVEIAKITGTRYDLLNVPTRSAFIKEPKNTSVETGTPIITCKDSNEKTLVIWLTLSNKNIAYSYGNCVILEAQSYNDLVRVADRLMYHLLGIMS